MTTYSAEDAAFLATILPIGLLIIAIEIRAIPSARFLGRAGAIYKVSLGTVLSMAVLWGMLATMQCIGAAVEGRPVSDEGSLYLALARLFMPSAVAFVFTQSLLEWLGFFDWVAAKGRAYRVKRGTEHPWEKSS